VLPLYNVTSAVLPLYNVTSAVLPLYNVTSGVLPLYNVTSGVFPPLLFLFTYLKKGSKFFLYDRNFLSVKSEVR
jgi:hypothetical protein